MEITIKKINTVNLGRCFTRTIYNIHSDTKLYKHQIYDLLRAIDCGQDISYVEQTSDNKFTYIANVDLDSSD